MTRTELWRRFKHLFWRILAKFPSLCGGVVLAEVQGRKIYLDVRDRVVCETLYTRGVWEEHVTRILLRLIRPGMVIVDGQITGVLD